MESATTSVHHHAVHHHASDDEYHRWLVQLDQQFQREVNQLPLFTTDVSNLWALYLDNLPPGQRQFHNCNACRHFIERFGGLALVSRSGHLSSPLWGTMDSVPDLYLHSVKAMDIAVREATVTGVFLADEDIGLVRTRIVRKKVATWGTPQTGMWHHFAVTAPARSLVAPGGAKNAAQLMAEKCGDFETVKRALGEFQPDMLQVAVSLLKGDKLYRSEKVLGQAEWLLDLQFEANRTTGKWRDAVIWRAVASAPAGFCHPRSSMIATLLEDLQGGMGIGQASKRFAEKMNPLRYQRPQAAPKAATIQQAEQLVEKLGIERALQRRMALAQEVQAIWQPHAQRRQPRERATSVFSHLAPPPPAASSAQLVTSAKTVITWVKFASTVLPGAAGIEVFVRSGLRSFSTLLTAVHPEAPPVLQWDSLEQRNPFSWYFWSGGSTPASFGLTAGKFHKVIGITLKPNLWNNRTDHHASGVLFMIHGARDTRVPGLCLFPEILRSDLHGVRSVIEAHSNSKKVVRDNFIQEAAGLLMQSGSAWDLQVRVTHTSGLVSDFTIDRWD